MEEESWKDMEKINFKATGLKVGIELHQQLDTQHKLFCNCFTAMKEKEPTEIVTRRQHPVAGELGEVDVATQYEYLRNRVFQYQVFKKETCLVELDEEPPHEMNREALQIALQIALLLNCKIPDEIHVMRKTVTDGSNTTAFQRTAIVGTEGFLRYKGGKIEIRLVSLEEDATANVSEENGRVTYRLNRLAVPLVEIATGILSGFSPEEIQNIAYNIGMLCRSTGKVKRGLGSIRQDINVSTKVGERVEIKGVQELSLLGKVVENEVYRQIAMDEVRRVLRKRGVKKIVSKPEDVTLRIRDTKSKIIKSIIESNGDIFAIRLNGFNGILKKEISPGRTLGRDLADFVSGFGVKGIIHSDEDLNKYQLVEEFNKLRVMLSASNNDAIVLIGEVKTKGKVADELIKRCNQILAGLKEETRGVNEDGTTRYNRPLPGEKRMYPETDVVPIVLAREYVEEMKKNLPEPWFNKLAKLKSKHKLSDDLAKQILNSEYYEMFERIVEKTGAEANMVANTFISTLKDLERREGVRVDRLNEKHYLDVFDFVVRKKILKEAIPLVLKYLSEYPGETVGNIISELNLTAISMDELNKIIEEVIAQPNLNYEKVVGLVMSKVRGRIDAQVVIKEVKRFVKS
jgi:glutamyl-tRNA(Gln) amidotransferase subunit E